MQFISEYEYCVLIAYRVKMLESGRFQPKVEYEKDMSLVDIAKKEFQQNKLPIALIREFENNKKIFVKNQDMFY